MSSRQPTKPPVGLAAERLFADLVGGTINMAEKWNPTRSRVRILEAFSYLGAVLLVVAVGWSLFMMIYGGSGVLNSLNNRCGRLALACGTVSGFVIPFLSVALASTVFLFYRLRHVKAPVARDAKKKPHDLVQTSSRDIGEIVGRDELCNVIMEDIRDRDTRRPHLLVGGVGTGKTAVLVRLTQMLGERGAIPVPIRLRDAQENLDFRKMAYDRFQSMTERRLLSSGEAEKVWRQLCKEDQVVIVADGLEEALSEDRSKDRDNVIRLAIDHARDLRLPLIIASRPHEPLRGTNATVMEIEPLSEDAALEYIDQGAGGADLRRLEWIVETAGLAELPLYLKITWQLGRLGRLDYLTVSQGQRKKKLDTRGLDRSALRLNLLNTWLEALLDGHLRARVPLDRREREAAVEWLSALACIGLKKDTIDVKFRDYYAEGWEEASGEKPLPRYPKMDETVQRAVAEKLPGRSLDMRLAVTWADRLGLVEAHDDALRFPHSIMEAYLGSRFMRTALEDEKFYNEAQAALKSPGREFLIALVLYSRTSAAGSKPPVQRELEAPHAASPPLPAGQATLPSPVSRRRREAPAPAAAVMPPAAATVAIDAATPNNAEASPAAQPAMATSGAAQSAPATPARDMQPIRDLLKTSAEHATDSVKALDIYAAALEIDSFLARPDHPGIAQSVAGRWADIRGGDQRTLDEAKLGLVFRFGDAVRTITQRRESDKRLPVPAYQQLLEIGCLDPSYTIRLAVAQEIGAGGDEAFRLLRGRLDSAQWFEESSGKPIEVKKRKKGGNRQKNGAHVGVIEGSPSENGNSVGWHHIMCAWLAPLLVGSVDGYRDGAQQELEQLLKYARYDTVGGSGAEVPISLEIALAQGFKYAANRRRRHPHARPEARVYLAEQALEMLKHARFWFSQLTLIHALCLWEMPEPGAQDPGRAGAQFTGAEDSKQPADQRGSNPEAIVKHWLEAARNPGHPFVIEAGELAVQALKTGRPERYLWIDESGVVSKVGARAAGLPRYRKQNLWIPPSTGWVALEPRAQQLVADVLLLLNLAERGDEPRWIEQRLKRTDRGDLPPCLTANRKPLDPKRTVGEADGSAPGTNCMDGCPFRLCPYPPNGKQPHRAELSEAFSRRQQMLLSDGLVRSRAARWQAIKPPALKQFWTHMADRARGGSEDHEQGHDWM